jgi:hypothetical protein
MLGNHTQLPSVTGPAQLMPHGAGARDTLAHESANATPGASITPTGTAAPRTNFRTPMFVLPICDGEHSLAGTGESSEPAPSEPKHRPEGPSL